VETAVVRRFGGARRRLIEALAERGLTDVRVLKAFDDIPRHLFVPTGVQHRAYEDAALPIGYGQTISQPWAHASALAALHLTGRERVLEVGTGSGFQSALLVGAAAPAVPEPLRTQLAVGGQLLMPIGERDQQRLLRLRRTAAGWEEQWLDPVRFVPLIGAHGFPG
jgi:protein-L-isoaspartate(D-aspartate) O-methyltransferase